MSNLNSLAESSQMLKFSGVEYPSTSVFFGPDTILSTTKVASLMALVAITASLSVGYTANGAGLGNIIRASYTPQISNISYNGFRGAISMPKRHAVTHVRGYTRTIERPNRYVHSLTEDTSRLSYSDRSIQSVQGKTQSVVHKSRWSQE